MQEDNIDDAKSHIFFRVLAHVVSEKQNTDRNNEGKKKLSYYLSTSSSYLFGSFFFRRETTQRLEKLMGKIQSLASYQDVKKHKLKNRALFFFVVSIIYITSLPSPLLGSFTSGSLSHSASEHSDAMLLCVVELESFSELSALPRTGGGGGKLSSSGPKHKLENLFIIIFLRGGNSQMLA